MHTYPGKRQKQYQDKHPNAEVESYIENEVIPKYARFDAAHREDHARMVIEQSMSIAEALNRRDEAPIPVNMDMVYVIAAMHDLGLEFDRKTHHLESGRIMRQDLHLRTYFTEDEIEVMAQAVEDHRASSTREPRSIYGKIVSEADRFIVPATIIERTVQYGLAHYPDIDRESHWLRTLSHLHEKYAEGGYLRLWFPESPNAARLEALRAIIRDEPRLKKIFDATYDKLTHE